MGIWDRLSHPEDGLTERKPEGAGDRDFKETLVSFANSVPQGSEGVLFVGISDKGNILGCKGVESLQKTISKICDNDCYPPISHRLEVGEFEGKTILAAIIPPSTRSPHFSGHAFRRVGSQNIKSDEAAYADFIVTRNSVGAKVIENRGRAVQVRTQGKRLGDPAPMAPNYREGGLFVIEACDPHTVALRATESGQRYVEQLENFSVSYEPSGQIVFWVRDVHK